MRARVSVRESVPFMEVGDKESWEGKGGDDVSIKRFGAFLSLAFGLSRNF